MKKYWILAAAGAVFALAVGAVAAPQAAPSGGAPFTSRASGLAFDLAPGWNLERTRLGWTVRIPLAEAAAARLEIFESEYRQELERWQESQRQANDAMGRTIARQWQEEVLGVPMAMTRIQYAEGAVDTTAVVALIYTATPRKLNFRLTAPTPQFAEAEQAWRDALQSLRTLSGRLPQAEDPNRPPAEAEPAAPPAARPPLRLTAEPDRRRLGGVVVPTRAGNQDWDLRLPGGWTAEAQDRSWRLTHPRLRGALRISVDAELDAPPAHEALGRAMAATLARFDGAVKRVDAPRRVNRAGAQILSATREGRTAEGGRYELWATGARGGAYWLLAYETAESADWAADRRLLRDLMDLAVVEPRPNP